MKFTTVISSKKLQNCPYPIANNIREAITTARNMSEALVETFGDQKLRLVCAGSSGAMLSALIASNLGTQVFEIIHTKKDGEVSHDDGHFIKDFEGCLNIIVDDLICSGATVERIYNKFITNNGDETIHCIIVNQSVSISIMNDVCTGAVVEKLMCSYTR